MLPMMMPDIVLGIGLLIFFVTMGMQLSLLTIIIGHCTFLTSYVFIIVQARIAGLDPALEEASADLGASEWTTLRKVLLPQLAPGILGGALLAFVISMDDLVITYFVSRHRRHDIAGLHLRHDPPRREARDQCHRHADHPGFGGDRCPWPVASLPESPTDMTRPRARDLGLPFPGTPGRLMPSPMCRA